MAVKSEKGENMVIGSQNILSGEPDKIKKGSLQLSEATASYFGFAGSAQIGDIAERFLIKKVCLEGHTYKEASLALKIPVNTVRSRLSRARGKLKTKYDRHLRLTA